MEATEQDTVLVQVTDEKGRVKKIEFDKRLLGNISAETLASIVTQTLTHSDANGAKINPGSASGEKKESQGGKGKKESPSPTSTSATSSSSSGVTAGGTATPSPSAKARTSP